MKIGCQTPDTATQDKIRHSTERACSMLSIRTIGRNNSRQNIIKIKSISSSSSSSSSSSKTRATPEMSLYFHQSKKHLSASSSSIRTKFPKWPNPSHESNGIYAEEDSTFVGPVYSDSSPLYQTQSGLPSLPVPTLEETMLRYASTALPLASNEDEKESLIKAMKYFPQQAVDLQKRLNERKELSDKGKTSWLSQWWNQLGYLQVRDTITINVSYFYHFSSDHTIPHLIEDKSIPRAATLMQAAAEFRSMVCSAQHPSQKIGKGGKVPLCSAAYKYMFHSCRIPLLTQDSVKMYDPSLFKHCIVAVNGQFFAVDFIDPETQNALPIKVLEKRLMKCKELAFSSTVKTELGWFTSWDRDSWAKARSILVKDDNIQKSLSLLQSGAFLVCLDDENPVSMNDCAKLLLHGNTGKNRWFDKSFQLICTPNGKAGLNGEHSMMDGMPTVQLADHLTSKTYEQALNDSSSTNDESLYDIDGGIQKVFGDDCMDSLAQQSIQIQSLLNDAKSHFRTLVGSHMHTNCSFHGYGSNYMKSIKISPDAYVQMIMQLASYRLFEKQVGTYEAIQVRKFLHGRTETGRAVSIESGEFVKAMGLTSYYKHTGGSSSPGNTDSEKVELFKKAANAHSKYCKDASQGHGVDRHLLGLSLLVKDGEKTPDLFSHPLYQRSKHWRVSTSHLTHPRILNWVSFSLYCFDRSSCCMVDI